MPWYHGIWLNVSERVEYKLAVMVRRCLENKAPKYLSSTALRSPLSAADIRSANQHQLIAPRCRRITFGRRAFFVAGPTVWNSDPKK